MEQKITFGVDGGEKSAPFLLSAKEDAENRISFVVALPRRGEKCGEDSGDGDSAVKKILRGAVPLCPDGEDVCEISFDGYILHQTRNESYTSYDDSEVFAGRHFVVFEKSRLLDLLPKLTDCRRLDGGGFYPEKWAHYGILCQNHVVDVVSCSAPKVRRLKNGDDIC